MNKYITFQTYHVEKTLVKRETLWKIWEDVNNWPKWDSGIQSTQLLTTFSTGGRFLLTPVGSPVSIEIALSEVVRGEKFVEYAPLPYGSMEVWNEMTSHENITTITHRITANIEESCANEFYETMWKSIEEGLPLSIKNAVLVAEKIESSL